MLSSSTNPVAVIVPSDREPNETVPVAATVVPEVLPVTSPVTLPVTAPVRAPVTVPTIMLPELSLFTRVLAVFAFVAASTRSV